ncbi:pentapeptide repeat-containing protein [Nonomuraea sp. NPDC026600]|uniref:pentapeptide repeat-containing protein n=1 Tax=Nonomuraea sp. NPDC026600 TaxID=3155363 RepID=UPI0033EA4ED6
MTEFGEQDLTGARFERVRLRDVAFSQVYLNDARMRAVDFTGARILLYAERDLTSLKKGN